mgnify:CR=1 FL=1|jgi:hypothetical protein
MRRSIPFVFLLIFLEASAMSFLNPTKTCVFSEVRARLVLNGEPLKGVKVTRQWNWNKKKTDESVSDEHGYVHFPAIFESSVARLLPTELVIGQQLSVEIDGQSKVFWANGKREPEENAEYGGARFNVVCELSDEEILIEDYGSLMVTMCKLER